ncbi:MAG: histidine kinase N-terminal 7TM domain-containing protein, partial [Halorientalis sp.]
GTFSAALAVPIYRNREKRGAIPLTGVLVSAVIWCFSDAIRHTTTDKSLKLLMNDVRFFGPILVTVSIFLFAASYTNREGWMTRRRVAGLFALHTGTLVLVWTNSIHHLVRQSATMYTTAGFETLDIQWGPWYYIHATYSYFLLVAAAWMLVDKLRKSSDVHTYKRQAVTILIGQLVPWGMNAAYIAGLTTIDLTSLGFTVTGAMFAIALFRYQILDLVPIARSTVVDNVDEGYIVLDTQDKIVDVNRQATEILGIEKATVIGKTIQEVYQDFPAILDQFENARDTSEHFQLELANEIRYYDIDISPIYDDRGQFTGRVVLFKDTTTQVLRKQQLEAQKDQLERQNERLEDFASIVSHDLRNPINVVSGRIELARRNPDDEHFEEMEDSLERMETIIDDMLAIAKQGQTVETPEQVDLTAVCEDAWSNVETRAASLTVDTDRSIAGDRNRLLQVFENLYRNAVEHGSSSDRTQSEDAIDHWHEGVHIRVGEIEDGFFVEDDGPGIPEDERDDVLEKGYTTAADGTGLGLSIVQTAVEAHGWDVTVTESSSGGARFEITGVETGIHAEVQSSLSN